MSGLSKVIVLDPDPRAREQVQFGLSRASVPVAAIADLAALSLVDAGVIIVGGTSRDLVRATRARLAEAAVEVPLLFAGREVERADALAAGADESIAAPAHLRDLVTLARLLRGTSATQRSRLTGHLAELTGMYPLVRAIAALGRSGVLTLIRGLRRGEVRFFHGEVTSAQVGMIHGQAALHQLLLWTDARFDFEREDVVRRHQIPLTPDELFADAARFLSTVRAESGTISPSMVFEPDFGQIQANTKFIPTEVHGILRMFDGYRSIADVLEDSPYRVFETLRVTQRAVEAALLREVATARARTQWHAMLAIEEWLVGPAVDGTVVAAVTEQSGTVTAQGRDKKKRKKRRANTPVPTARPAIDWGALVPRVVGAEVGPLAGVVPVMHVMGEIDLPSAPPAASAARAGHAGPIDPAAAVRTVAASEPSVIIGDEANTAVPPAAIDDEPSDGVIRDALAASETGPKLRHTPPATDAVPIDDRPPETTGEITAPRTRTADRRPRPSEPSVLVADLAAAQQSIAAVVQAEATAAPGRDAAPLLPALDAAVEAVRADARAGFSDLEEEFFRTGAEERPVGAPAQEAFADLDEGYQQLGFWERLLGRRKPRRR